MSGIRVVSFDMEGTLVDHAFSKLIWEVDMPRLYSEERGVGLDEAKRLVLAEYMTVGDQRPEWYDVGYWFKRLRLPGDWRDLLRNRMDACTSYAEAKGVLRRLGRRYALVVTSNTIREFLEVQLRCLDTPFARVFSAPSDFNDVKRSPEFYSRVCEELGVSPTEVAHVGDHPVYDYEAARALGIKAYHLDRSGKAVGADVVHDLLEFEVRLNDA
jgi:FMN phosphatase YigB (HAD superfamily)